MEEISNAEQDSAPVGGLRGLARRLLNRKTLLISFQILYWIVKIARLIGRLTGNS